MNYRDFLQKVIYQIINPIIKAMITMGITPNIVTFIGFLGNIVAATFFLDAAWMLGMDGVIIDENTANQLTGTDGWDPYNYAYCMQTIGWGGLIILAAGLFDMMDGAWQE